jgi:hypothetical protein
VIYPHGTVDGTSLILPFTVTNEQLSSNDAFVLQFHAEAEQFGRVSAEKEGPVNGEAYVESEPPSLVGWSIAVLLCCCLPGGIIGLAYGTKAKTEYAKGNYVEARSAYETGKKWLIGSVIASAITNIIYIAVKVSQ